MSNVLIIGGGVIGCSCAYYLSRAGQQVTIIDKGEIGMGCSYGNAGLLTPSHAFPLPMPGAVSQGLKWMLNRDSPLYIKPRLSLSMARWLLGFMSHANHRHLQHAAAALSSLAQYSRQLFDDYADEHGADSIKLHKQGVMYACSSEAGFKAMQHELDVMMHNGWPGRTLDSYETRKINPALTGPLVGSIYYEGDAHAEPLLVVQQMAHHAQNAGATVLPNTEVFEFELSGNRITGVRTTHGLLKADQYILATGSWSPLLAKQLRMRVPIQAGKGYGIIIEPLDPPVNVPVLLIEKKICVTPRNGSIRLAGTMELAGLDESISPHRVDAILRGARQCMNMPQGHKTIEVWRGLRPCTPDGLPMIGGANKGKWTNLYLAAGHAMLGLTLCTGTGKLIADMITGNQPEIDASPFAADRSI
jgi:D-amino-acid dehydrogenase